MLNNTDSFNTDDESAQIDVEATQSIDIAIMLNGSAEQYECALCGDERLSAVGPELYLAESWELVCHECAREHAPLLVALIDLGGAAEGYVAVRWSSEPQSDEP